jgi:hypothetical protein
LARGEIRTTTARPKGFSAERKRRREKIKCFAHEKVRIAAERKNTINAPVIK